MGTRHVRVDLRRVILVDRDLAQVDERKSFRLGERQHDLFLRREPLLNDRHVEVQADRFGVTFRLFQVFGSDDPVPNQNLAERAGRLRGRRGVRFAAERLVVFRLPLLVGQTEHRLGQLVEELLRLVDVVAGGESADIRVQFPVVVADHRGVVFERFEFENLIEVQRAVRR